MMSNISDLEWNIKTHNKLAKKYEHMHGEIYNEYEQLRLSEELTTAIAEITTDSHIKVALDFGCGAGNLTRHLSNLGCEVLACDVSRGFLDLVTSRKYLQNVKSVHLNGHDLGNIADESVDMVATYSVLHHVPDYIGILKEFMRVVKPGGIIYIDHEPSDEFWKKNQIYQEFTLQMNRASPINYKKYFILTNYYDWIIRKLVNPRYQREGDIHVFEDDHVEWKRVIKSLLESGGELVLSKSYLLFRRNFNISIYNRYKDQTNDMHVLVVRKK
jgi:ubiquinone/menaquinone biosynthesis C-methylase UbiE